MYYVMVLTICVASTVLPHKDLCKQFVDKTPYTNLDECLDLGKAISEQLSYEGYYTSVFCNKSHIINFERKDI